jgi:hypothetical protein
VSESTHLEETAKIIQDEVYWRLLGVLWEIADLPIKQQQRATELAFDALSTCNAESGGAVWRRLGRPTGLR